MIKYDDVKDVTTEEFFNNNQFSIDAFKNKYAQDENETYVQALKRVCDYIASAEENDKLKEYWSNKWFNEIYNGFWHPAGSIMQGAASVKKISLMNCTTISLPDDSLEGIIKYNEYRVAKCAAYRQGLGVDFSLIRPVGTHVYNSSNDSQGTIHWMKKIDSVGYYVGQRGRIPAMLFSLSCKHPDLELFITVKSDHTKIQNANISVQINNSFYEAVENNDDWEMIFILPEVKKGQRIYLNPLWDDLRLADDYDKQFGWYYKSRFNRKEEKIIKKKKARYILKLISENMYKNGEPGIQNIDIAKKYSNSDVVGFPILSTNACCVVEDTKIMTNKGWFTIKELFEKVKSEEQFLVMSYNIEENKYELKEILNVWQQRNDTTVELEIEENNKIYKIECSADHKIYTKNRGYIEAKSLTSDDDIMIFK